MSELRLVEIPTRNFRICEFPKSWYEGIIKGFGSKWQNKYELGACRWGHVICVQTPSNWCVRFNPCKMEQELQKFILKENLINQFKMNKIIMN